MFNLGKYILFYEKTYDFFRFLWIFSYLCANWENNELKKCRSCMTAVAQSVNPLG